MIQRLLPLLVLCTAAMAIPEECSRVTFTGDALYWQPTSTEFDYGSGNGSVQTICPDLTWGVRLAGGYRLPYDCLRIGLSGLWFDSSDVGRTEDLHARLQTEYWNGDLRIGFPFHNDTSMALELFAGGRFASIKERRWVNPGGVERMSFHGGGPLVGLLAQADLLCGIGVEGELAVIPVIGERKHRVDDLIFRCQTVIAPEVDVRLALTYSLSWSCLELQARLGYELHYFFHPFSSVLELNGSGTPRRPEDIGFGGPTFGIKVGF